VGLLLLVVFAVFGILSVQVRSNGSLPALYRLSNSSPRHFTHSPARPPARPPSHPRPRTHRWVQLWGWNGRLHRRCRLTPEPLRAPSNASYPIDAATTVALAAEYLLEHRAARVARAAAALAAAGAAGGQGGGGGGGGGVPPAEPARPLPNPRSCGFPVDRWGALDRPPNGSLTAL
jgi:hypothetical protein